MKLLFFSGVAAIGIGVPLILVSLLWTLFVPQQAVWSVEQAAAYQQASAQYHSDQFDKDIDAADLQQSKAEFESYRRQLDTAITVRDDVPVYLRYAGLALGITGAALLLGYRSAS